MNVGGSANPRTWQLKGAPEMFMHAHTQVHWKSLQKREPIFILRSKTCSGSNLAGSEGLPRLMAWGAGGSLSTAGCAFPSPSHKAEQSLHTGWFFAEDLPPQPFTQCLDLPAPVGMPLL